MKNPLLRNVMFFGKAFFMGKAAKSSQLGKTSILLLLLIVNSGLAFAQNDRTFIRQGNKLYRSQKWAQAETQYRKAISKNARIPFKDVAAECNVSRAAIHQRVQHLIEGHVIMGSGFDVNPKSLGYTTCTYVGITLERGSMYKDVVERIQHIPEIVECHFTTGPYTMLVKLYARDNEQLMQLLNGQLQDIPGVVATETLISLEQSIKREIPIGANE